MRERSQRICRNVGNRCRSTAADVRPCCDPARRHDPAPDVAGAVAGDDGDDVRAVVRHHADVPDESPRKWRGVNRLGGPVDAAVHRMDGIDLAVDGRAVDQRFADEVDGRDRSGIARQLDGGRPAARPLALVDKKNGGAEGDPVRIFCAERIRRIEERRAGDPLEDVVKR